MTGKSFVENHAVLFEAAIFDRDVVAATRWLTYTFHGHPQLRAVLDAHPYTIGAYLVATHMHAHAASSRTLQWEIFDPGISEHVVVGILWRLSSFEVAMVGMSRHIKGAAGRRVLADPEGEADHIRALERALSRAWLTGAPPASDQISGEW